MTTDAAAPPRRQVATMNPVMDTIRVIMFSEHTAWAVQNAVGAVLPLLFVVVQPMSFSGVCVGMLFYGIGSQAFSIDRTIGGRNFGAILWSGGFFFGGIVALAVVSLAWLARGSAQALADYSLPVQSSLLTADEEELVKGYLSDASFSVIPDTGKNTLVPLLEKSLEQFNSDVIDSAYWIIIMFAHVVISMWITRARTNETDFMNTARGTIGHVYMSVVMTLSAVMPSVGQDGFWTHVVGGMAKGVTVTLAGVMLAGTLVYVQSSHDALRASIGNAMLKTGKYLTAAASVLGASASESMEKRQPMTAEMLQQFKRTQKAPRVSDILKQTSLAEMSVMLCALEPPWPMLTSQWGADYRLYATLLKKLQLMLGSVNAIDFIAQQMIHEDKEKIECQVEEQRVMTAVSVVLGRVATVMADSAMVLNHMPLWGKCSGNEISWRPKSIKFWDDTMKELAESIYSSMGYLKECSCLAVEQSLKTDKFGFTFGGSGLLLVTACESLVDECIEVQIATARALAITDAELYDFGKHAAIPESPKAADSIQKSPWKIFTDRVLDVSELLITHPYTSSCVNLILSATSLYTWQLEISRFFLSCKQFVTGSWLGKDRIKQLLKDWNVQFYLKFFFSVNLSFIAVILIIWKRFGNSDSAIKNATNMATFYGNWQPGFFVSSRFGPISSFFGAEYFFIASVICMQQVVEASFVKGFLRVTLIAAGGVLGYVTMLNGTLAQNPYFIFFMGIIMNGFFGLFSPLGMDFRYSLFLMVYTWNGVVFCQYTGTCCKAGSVLEFGGKASATALGAIYALLVGTLIKPLYASQVIYSLEKKFLQAVTMFLEDSYHQGSELLKQVPPGDTTEVSNGSDSSPYAYIKPFSKFQDIKKFQDSVQSVTNMRLGVMAAIMKTKNLSSLDRRQVLFVKVTLIPLPLGIDLTFARLDPMGAFVSGAFKTLRSTILRRRGGAAQEYFLGHMLDPMDSMLISIRKLSAVVSSMFESNSPKKLVSLRIPLKDALHELSLAREPLQSAFHQSKDGLLTIEEWLYGDLKCMVWYQFLMTACAQLEDLGRLLLHDDRAIDRDNYFSWITTPWTRRRYDDSRHFIEL